MRMARREARTPAIAPVLAAWTGSVGLPYTPCFSPVHTQDMTDAAPKLADYPLPVLPLGRYRLRFREEQREDGASLMAPQAGYLGSAWRFRPRPAPYGCW